MATAVDEGGLLRHVTALSADIGERLAGTEGEKAAGDYVADELRRAGATVTRESFPVNVRAVGEERLEVRVGRAWRSFPCFLFSNTPGTRGRTVEAPLVFLEAPAEADAQDLARLRGKAVVHLGCHIESRASYRRLVEAAPAFLLFVDVRYPGAVPLADGMFPAYTEAIGAVPTVNVAYMDAWEWARTGASAARLTVRGGMRPGVSENVIGEFAGGEPGGGILYLGAHHDTQAASPGADDNAAGVAGIIELARVLADRPRRRTLRFVSFGAEEQLSVGSAVHVRARRAELRERGRIMFNLDACGSLMGWTEIVCNGPARLAKVVKTAFARHGLPVRMLSGIVPYADHFPFVAAGVPGVWLGRNNCTAGRFFHHRPDDDPSRLSIPLMGRLLDAAAEMLAGLCVAPRLPFPVAIPAGQARAVERFWSDLFGGWNPHARGG